MKINEIICEAVKLNNEQKEEIIKDFINFVSEKLHITTRVDIDFSYDVDAAQDEHHTGSYNRTTHQMFVYMHDRNLVDILRTICHEFQHVKQDQQGKLNQNVLPGNKIEAEAAAVADILIKLYSKNHHEIYQ